MYMLFPGNRLIVYLFLCLMSGFSACSPAKTNYLLVGTYTNSGSKGIYVFDFNEAEGILEPLSNTDSVVNPSFVTFDDNFIYAVNETNGDNPGSVSSFSFEEKAGKLTFINKEATGGDDPCYVTLSPDNKWLFAANYSGGSLTAFPVKEDGSIAQYAQLIQHEGSGADKDRQSKPHVHSTVFSPDGKYLLSADLGLDKIFVYAFNSKAPKPLEYPAKQSFEMPPASGPRHITFSPEGEIAYVVRELDGMVSVLKYNDGELRFLQEIATHPEGNRVKMDGAEIKVSPDGKFLYTSNRGNENALAIFSINKDTGELTHIGYQPTFGKNPRNFLIDPTGKYLLVANQDSDNIVIFKRNADTGLLEKTGKEIKVPRPVYLTLKER